MTGARPDIPREAYLDVRNVEDLTAPELKTLIVDAARAGYLRWDDAQEMISFFGLRKV